MITIYKTVRFEASHVLPLHPGKCSRLHGHSWVCTVGVTGPINPETGFVMDYADLSEIVKSHIVDLCDHQHLGRGDINPYGVTRYYPAVLGQDFYPSSENLVVAFSKILTPFINNETVKLTYVSLEETCTCRAEWRSNG